MILLRPVFYICKNVIYVCDKISILRKNNNCNNIYITSYWDYNINFFLEIVSDFYGKKKRKRTTNQEKK